MLMQPSTQAHVHTRHLLQGFRRQQQPDLQTSARSCQAPSPQPPSNTYATDEPQHTLQDWRPSDWRGDECLDVCIAVYIGSSGSRPSRRRVPSVQPPTLTVKAVQLASA
jgi:hypothetical protein